MNFEYMVEPHGIPGKANDTYASWSSAEISSCSWAAPMTERCSHSGHSTSDHPYPGCNHRFSFNSNSYSFLESSFSLFKLNYNMNQIIKKIKSLNSKFKIDI